jgi:hypothetical protein
LFDIVNIRHWRTISEVQGAAGLDAGQNSHGENLMEEHRTSNIELRTSIVEIKKRPAMLPGAQVKSGFTTRNFSLNHSHRVFWQKCSCLQSSARLRRESQNRRAET